jgi:tetratricopeptide (TPR) repeat protein
MGKLLDQLGRYNEAFAHYQNANDLAPDHFDAGELADRTDRLMTTCSRDALAGFSKSMLQSGPVFIVGMPRSGTTLLEQILSSHPGIHGAGELMHISEFVRRLPSFLGPGRDYPECLAAVDQRMLNNLAHEYMDHAGQSAGEAKCIIDKMPQNYLHLGLIQMLFPNARILHCLRHPLDTCLSNYFQSFHAAHQYANRLKNIATYYRHYWRLMRHWKSVLDIPILDIVYEKLVDDQETVSRTAVQFCGMPWDERCLRFHETKKLVITASYRQVRQPLYRSSMARWKKYEAHLAELTDELGDVLTEYEQKYSSPPGLPY